jgi:hypothetical protein
MKEIKGIHIEEEEVKLFLFADVMFLYFKHPKNSMKKFLYLINTFNKIA